MRKEEEFGRQLFAEETMSVCLGLVEEWFNKGQTAALTRYIFSEFGRGDGSQEISTFARLLVGAGDFQNLATLFRGLISRRLTAFYQQWPSAQAGHLGYMQSAAYAMARAMDVYVEYCIWLDKLNMHVELENVRAEMLRFQSRLAKSKVVSGKAATGQGAGA